MANWFVLLLALILFGVSGLVGTPDQPDCATADGCGPVATAWTPVTIDGHEGVILTEDAVPELISNYGLSSTAESYWTPTEADIQAAESALVRHMGRTPGLGAHMLDVTRQYGGYVENGERKLFVNSFCAGFDDWQSEVIYVLDGGDCFWQAVYNVDRGEIEAIWVNFSA